MVVFHEQESKPMAAAKSDVLASRLKREDQKHTKHDSWFSKWKVLIGPNDWEDYSAGKEGVSRYRVENLPKSSCSGLYELAIYCPGSSSRSNTSKLDPGKALVVYLGEADNVRTRLQQYGRAGAHLCRSSSGEKGCGRLEDVFSRGCFVVYRWAPMADKAEARRTEAQLLKTFDYPWNKGSNGARRHDDIRQKLDKGAANGTSLANGESFSISSQVFKFGRSQPRLVLDRGGSNKSETITCGVVLEDGAICRRPPFEGRKRCAEHKGKKTKGTGFDIFEAKIPSIAIVPSFIAGNCPAIKNGSPVCGVAMNDGSICRRQPVSGRKRCDMHKGMKICKSNSSANDASGFDKSSEILIPGKVELGVAPCRPVDEGCDVICGVDLPNGYPCTKQPAKGRIRCEEHKGLRVTSLLSGSDAKGTSQVADVDSRFNSYNWNYSSTSVSICGAPTHNGSSCQRKVEGHGRCWQHLNYNGGGGGGSYYFSPKYSDYGGSGACGAPTSNGTSCQRTVKGNGRCWQHLNYDGGSSSSYYSSPKYSDYGGGGGASICGAPTRNGSYCRRAVKGHGRCWQH